MNIEQKINKLEQELKELKKQAENYKPKYWKPKNGEKAWYIENDDICSSCQWISPTDETLVTLGNVFQTEEEAEKELELRLATQRLKEAIWEANGGEFIGFVPDVLNVIINVCDNGLAVAHWAYTQANQNWMYIKDRETAEKVLEKNRKDFEIYYDI